MLKHAKNGQLAMDGTTMDYVSFGEGDEALVILPGLGDGLRTVRGMAVPLAAMYRRFGEKYRVYVFSRKNPLPRGCSTRDMAMDLRTAMEHLGIRRADLMGISQGGMIAQHFAADFPELVGRLVLAATASQPNPVLETAVSRWIGLAEEGRYRELMRDNAELMYTEAYLRRHRLALAAAGRFGRPASFERFIGMAEGCLRHRCCDRLSLIRAETLVMGGEKDRVMGPGASRELAAEIKGSRLVMYLQYGHALYEEAADFQETVLRFLGRETFPIPDGKR